MLAQLLWHSLNMLPLVVAIGVAMIAAVVWLYPSQVRKVRLPWRWVLPLLRASGLLVLCASLLQPAARRLRTASERAAVVILLDRSKSMSVIDTARPPAELVAIADALGQLPAGARAGAATGLGFELEKLHDDVAGIVSAGHDVETAEAFGRGVEPARARLSAARSQFNKSAGEIASRALSIPDAGGFRTQVAAVSGIPDNASRDAWAAEARGRIDAARTAVAGFQADEDLKIYQSNPQVKNACDVLAKTSRWSLGEHAMLDPEQGIVRKLAGEMPILTYAIGDNATPLPSSPTGTKSNITGAVSAAIAAVGERPIRAIVLVSDGRQVGEEPAVISELSPSGAPVFTVGLASAARAPDLAFTRNIAVQQSAFVGETVVVRTAVRSTGSLAATTEVQLNAGKVIQSQLVDLKPDAASEPVEFSIRLDHGGLQRITLSIPPVAGEITAENNVVERWIKVLPERMKIASFTATPGWDFQLLRNSLSRTDWIRLESGVLDPAVLKFPLTAEQILQQDVIVLSDVPAGALDDVQWDAVNRLVRERGGSLFMLAGPDFLPSTYTPETIVPSALLPYDVKNLSPGWRTWPGEQGAFRLVPANQLGPDRAAALRIGPDSGNLRNWQSLPGAFRFMPITELNPRMSVRPMLVEADSRLPVLTEGFLGNGRVFFLGTDETWRWRFKTGSRDIERFWLQLMRYAAGEPYAVKNATLALDADKSASTPQDAIAVRARILRADATDFRMAVVRDGKIVQQQSLTLAGETGSGRYSATVSGLSEGEYLLRLAKPAVGDTESTIEMPLHVAASSEAEMADVSGDESLLRRIADASGGRHLTLDRLSELPRLLATADDTRSQYSEQSLWDSPLLFVFVVACFGAEWALRKRVGLA